MRASREGLGSVMPAQEEGKLDQVKRALLSKMREGTAGVEGYGEEQACKQVFSMGNKHNFDLCK